MKTNVYLGIALRLIALFTVAILATYLPAYFPASFFDDYVTTQGNYEWGVRHYWYAVLMFLLFVLSLVNVIVSIEEIIKKNYPDKK